MEQPDFSYTVTTARDFEAAVKAVEEATAAQGMKVQHVHDVQATLRSKGYDSDPLKIIEICNARYAHEVLAKDILISLMMPCKINVYVRDGKTYISALRPTMLAQFFPHARLEEVAREVDTKIRTIVEAAR
ncbi:DUF302 domain-containing protein [Neomoorella thermoacetica]|uniref:DUF302 domain-containing protein n=1 Tax=Moorella thermoacetica (strain ATCC 39073 / JCM 9320) TaxID=264732 RepID=Q2RJ12_MOOTA|nr:DUF302 domain-containing protein [Moorella thermoacetica]AKX94038.1 hypothetical protein MOTHE_c12440 [Moorella thermoacetica]AKX96677.1 hypothetical protein MOTHA_c13300 [Moorella thermoacetica]APC08430.1 hypothetical protein MTJW_12700 [Moorella thermoacetica]OIQ56406.1 hypothetical protein MORE_02710 [Moorella thermoacetica]OIQ57847.1 hypothetical protein MOCA_02710 [Moorella thermoacetica]